MFGSYNEQPGIKNVIMRNNTFRDNIGTNSMLAIVISGFDVNFIFEDTVFENLIMIGSGSVFRFVGYYHIKQEDFKVRRVRI